MFGVVAQLGERIHGMDEVRGSIPLDSTSFPCFSVVFARMKTLAPLLCFAALACNAPPKDPLRDGADAGGVPTATSAAPVAVPTIAADSGHASATPSSVGSSTPPAKPAACASDADCRTYSSYCQEAPCACRALGKNEGDPKCLGSGPKVNCFVNPCVRKAAHCQSGACVLTAQGTAATDR